MQNEQLKLILIDKVMIFVTSMIIFMHVKQYLASGSAFMLNALLGIWISVSIFDIYARWRAKSSD